MTIPNKLKTAFDNKADINHNHDNKYASINDVADVLGDYINETELAAKNFVSSTAITRIEVVDALPSNQEDGVLYVVK